MQLLAKKAAASVFIADARCCKRCKGQLQVPADEKVISLWSLGQAFQERHFSVAMFYLVWVQDSCREWSGQKFCLLKNVFLLTLP